MFQEKRNNKPEHKKFIIMEITLIAIIFIVALVLYWYATITQFEDPIEKMKNNFLITQLRTIGISALATAIVIILFRDKRKLILNLTIVAMISIVMIIAQVGAKIYMDNTYDEEAFEKLYENNKEDDEYYKDISISLSGVRLIGAKESYVKKSINAYNIFKMKTIIFIIVHILIVILILYIINGLTIVETNKARLNKDEIFYSKEE